MKNIYKNQNGQSMVEFIVVFPILIFLVFGVIQWALIYQARSTLNYAALLSARAGALNNGKNSNMREGLADGLIPLFTSDANTSGYLKGQIKSKIETATYSKIEILNPTKEAFNDFKNLSINGKEIPNDTLMYRDDRKGGTSGLSIQDANILHIRVTYCYRLIVPLVGRMIYGATKLSNNLIVNNKGSGMSNPFGNKNELPINNFNCNLIPSKDPRIPITTEAVVRMQTPYRASI